MNAYFGIGKKVRLNALAVCGTVPLFLLNGVECMCIIFICAACHEAAHVIAIKAGGGRIKRVDVGFLCAEIVYGGEKMTLADEAVNSFAGIAVNTLLFVCELFLYRVYPDVRLAFAALCNAALAAVNLVPARGLDGYNALYALTQMRYDANRAYTICERVSRISSLLLSFAVLYSVIKTGLNTSVLLLCMTAASMRSFGSGAVLSPGRSGK